MIEQVVARKKYSTPDGEIRIDVLECGHVVDVTDRKEHKIFRTCKECPGRFSRARQDASAQT